MFKPKTASNADEKFLDILKGSKLVQDELAAQEEAAVAARRALADEIVTLDERSGRVFTEGRIAEAKTLAAVRLVQQQLEHATRDYLGIRAKHSGEQLSLRMARDRAEQALIDGASPKITEFIREMFDERERTCKLVNRIEGAIETHPRTGMVTDNRRVVGVTVAQRLAAVMAAMRAAEALRLEPDQRQVEMRLDAIRSSIPVVGEGEGG